MATDISNSPYLQPLTRKQDSLVYSRHYARRYQAAGKASKDSWIKKLWSHVFTRKKNPAEQARVDARDAQAQEKHKERLAEAAERSNTIIEAKNAPDSATRRPILPPIKTSASKSVHKEVASTQPPPSRGKDSSQIGARSKDNAASLALSHSSAERISRESSDVSSSLGNGSGTLRGSSRESREKKLINWEMNSPYLAPRERPNYKVLLLERQKEFARQKDTKEAAAREERRDRRFELPQRVAKDPIISPARPRPDYVNISGQVDSWRMSRLSKGVTYAETENRARKEAAKAMKVSKIFSCEICFPMDAYIRHSLRKRGWVEKFNPTVQNSSCRGGTSAKLQCEHDEDFEALCEQGVPPPWEEDHGVYAIMSRLVRNFPARFIWGTKALNTLMLREDVLVNHWPKARYFTSKTSIVESLRESSWHSHEDAQVFFPRCYLLNDDEKDDVVDDFRLTACVSLLKWVLKQVEEEAILAQLRAEQALLEEQEKEKEAEKEPDPRERIQASAMIVVYKQGDKDKLSDGDLAGQSSGDTTSNSDDDLAQTESPLFSTPPEQQQPHDDTYNNNSADNIQTVATGGTDSDRNNNIVPAGKNPSTNQCDNKGDLTNRTNDSDTKNSDAKQGQTPRVDPKSIVKVLPDISRRDRSGGQVPVKAVDWALSQCEQYLRFRKHEDIDLKPPKQGHLQASQWDMLLKWYYRVAHEGAMIASAAEKEEECRAMLERIREYWPQIDMDGLRNIWIAKPAAKSKGIGIAFCDRLEDILKYTDNSTLQGQYVVQKYIERPLLLYSCKFDIRQWFLVTDWNPLTVWFYKDCYLRICSQEFSYDSMHESVHLSNVSIQQYYLNGQRSNKIPDTNFMTSTDFVEYLSGLGCGPAWQEIVYPGMKRAIICTLLSTLDVSETRKCAFELYGADFMLTDDFTPWLLEINASPGMAPSSKEKAKLCAAVIEDTIKVVVDQREDKSADTGQFECVFKDVPLSTSYRCVDTKLWLKGSRFKRVVWEKFAEIDQKAAKLEAEKQRKKDKVELEKKKQLEEAERLQAEKEQQAKDEHDRLEREKELQRLEEEQEEDESNSDDDNNTPSNYNTTLKVDRQPPLIEDKCSNDTKYAKCKDKRS